MDQYAVNSSPSLNSHNISSASSTILNESLTSTSGCYYSPILNEIFEYKSCLNDTKTAFYNLSTSIFLCFITILLITTSDVTYIEFISNLVDYEINEILLEYTISTIKMILLLIFITFFLSIFYSSWTLISSSIKKLSFNVLNKKLNNEQKKLLGDVLFEDSKKELDDETTSLLQPQQQQHVSNNLPYFTLISPNSNQIQSKTSPNLLNSQVFNISPTAHQRSFGVDSKDNEAVNLNEKYVNTFFTKLEECEKFEQQRQLMENNSYTYNFETLGSDSDAFERYNYQQKQKNFLDSSLELRNYQYQVGSRPINFPTTSVAGTMLTSVTQSPATTPTRTNPMEHFSKLTHSPPSYSSFKSQHQSTQTIKHENYFTDEINIETVDHSNEDLIRKLTLGEDLRLHSSLAFDDIQNEQIWCKKFNLNRNRLDIERENLRKWISLTILKPIIKEINSINDQIAKLGNNEMKIGQASVSQLNSLAVSSKLLRSLPILIPYLEVTKRQEYLIQRLNELAINGCISGYHWNNGGLYNNKEWIDYLPTDASLLMHIFCTYMDSRLLPRYPNLKPFTTQYFYREPNKKSNDLNSVIKSQSLIEYQQFQEVLGSSQQKNSQQQQQQSTNVVQVKQEFNNMKLYIHEFKSDPPCYRIVFNKDSFDIHHGRNNLFDSILCFLHLAKEELNGTLGAVDLGSSGVNLLSVIDC